MKLSARTRMGVAAFAFLVCFYRAVDLVSMGWASAACWFLVVFVLVDD